MRKRISTTLLIFLFIGVNVYSQQFLNLDFSQKCDTSKTGLCYWDLSWGGKNAVVPEIMEGRNAVAITSQNENAVGFLEQGAITEDAAGIKILSISSSVKCEEVIGKGAGLNIGLYDSDDVLLASKDMGGFYSIDWITGTHDWKKYTISIVIPAETRKIKVGMILFGRGKVWFSDFEVISALADDRQPSKLASKYIASACDIISKNSLVRDSIEIESLKETALKIAGPAKSYSDCFLAVDYLLGSLRPLGDYHSFFMSAEEVKNWESEGSQVVKIEFPSYKVIDDCGYISVPPFHGGNQKLISAYADSLQKAVQILNSKKVKGWIVDLRKNTGGNMEPMIAGLGPLFSAAKLGSLVDVNGDSKSWYYKDGRYYGDDYKGWTVTKPFQLTSDLPIAVLTSHQTGSSGEVVAISFVGNANTKSFGQPTWGLTTGNGSFELKDGSQIFLASTIMADRNGNQYTTSIDPDVLIEDIEATATDEVMDEAIRWLLGPK